MTSLGRPYRICSELRLLKSTDPTGPSSSLVLRMTPEGFHSNHWWSDAALPKFFGLSSDIEEYFGDFEKKFL